MGKKRQREAELVENYETYVTASTSDHILQSQENKDLYSIDRVGSKNTRKRIEKNERAVESKDFILSKVENKLIRKKMNQKKKQKSESQQSESQRIVDLWEEEKEERMEEGKEIKGMSKKKDKKPALRIPLPGISYNPSHVDHQDAVAEAVALALKHEEEKVRKSIGYDPITLHTLVSSESTERGEQDDDSGDDSEKEETLPSRKTSLLERKQPERKTKTQRNKEKNRSKLKYELYLRQKEKKFLKSIHNAPKLVKEIEKKMNEQEIKRKALQNLIQQTKEEESKQLTYSEAGVVPLSDELNGTLRQIKPKGIAVAEQVNSMVKSGDMMALGRRKKRKGENPFAGKRVKWIPKYKYGV